MKDDDTNNAGAERAAYLIAGYIRQTLTEKEHDELDDWITDSDENMKLFEELTDPVNIAQGMQMMKNIDAERVRNRIKSKITFTGSPKKPARKRWLPYTIAASFVLLAGLAIFFMTNKKTKSTKEIVKANVIKPGGNYAILTLANGKAINLADAKNGLLDSTNGNEVLKTADGQISYENVSNELMKYHILSTPVGGQYSVTLPDGSRVWLNSMSSLKYPVVFAENERVVELSGEAYFEVIHETSPGSLTPNPSPEGEGGKTSPGSASHPLQRGIPFIVKVNGMRVEVLGTHFNVNAYADEQVVRTVLLEGKVRIVSGEWSMVNDGGSREDGKSGSQEVRKSGSWELKPGEEARMDKRGGITVSSNVDIDAVVAWKNGMFMFKGLPIEDVMRQVSRWYGAEIVYDGKADHHFNATIYRKEPIEKLLHLLEETNEVHFRVEGKRIVVRN